MPRTVIGFIILTLSLPVFGQTKPAKIRFAELFADSDYQRIIDDLIEVRKRDRDYFRRENFDYLMARASESAGHLSSSAASYQSVVERDSELSPYALKHLATLMHKTGNLGMERLFLDEIRYSSKESIPRLVANERLLRNLFESSDFEGVILALTKGTARLEFELLDNGRNALVILGNAYLRLGRVEDARSVFRKLLDEDPNESQPDDNSLAAVRGLDQIDYPKGIKKNTDTLPASEHKRRADIFQFNRDFESARSHYDAILRNPETSLNAFALYQIGRGFDQERNYSEAVPQFLKIRVDYPKDPLSGPALYALAGAHANLDSTNAAVSAYREFIAEYPESTNIERAYLNIVDAYRDAQDEKLALEWCESTVKAFKGGIGEAAGLFAKVRIHMAAEDWESVLSTLDRLQLLKTFGGKSLAGATNENEVQFLRGLALEKQNRTSEMLTVYLSLKKEDRDYFGWRASDRLSRLLNDSNKPTGSERAKRIKIKSEIEESLFAREQEEIDPWRLPESIDPNDELVFPKLANPNIKTGNFAKSGSIAYALIDLGLYDEASPELELEMAESESDSNIELRRFDPDIAYKLATYHSKGGFADRAIRYIEPKWKKVHREYPETKIPVDDALLLYPAPFRYLILNYSKQENVDPRFVLSIMRQESRFQADIKSAAAARGLMQFITNTSGKIANELRIENFEQDELYNPETGIRFGAHYIANIFKDFPDKPHAVAASYNGGEDRMARWLRRAKSGDPDQYVSEVLFPQTKDYVYKVMANYRMYRLIYDENLVPRHKIRSSGIR